MHTLTVFPPSPCHKSTHTHTLSVSLCPLTAHTVALSQLSIIVVLLCLSYFLCADISCDSCSCCSLDVCFISCSLNHGPYFLFLLFTLDVQCLLSLWSDSLLAWCLEQLSNLINSIIRPPLLPGCFTPRGKVHSRFYGLMGTGLYRPCSLSVLTICCVLSIRRLSCVCMFVCLAQRISCLWTVKSKSAG